jgi:hypothetical protein
MGLTVADGKGTGLNVLADPERLRLLELSIRPD